MKIFVPMAPAPTRREHASRALRLAIRCIVAGIAGVGVTAIILAFAAILTIAGDVVVTAALVNQ